MTPTLQEIRAKERTFKRIRDRTKRLQRPMHLAEIDHLRATIEKLKLEIVDLKEQLQVSSVNINSDKQKPVAMVFPVARQKPVNHWVPRPRTPLTMSYKELADTFDERAARGELHPLEFHG